MSFAGQVREELAHAPFSAMGAADDSARCCRLAETAAILRLGGAVHLERAPSGERLLSYVVVTDTGAVARRLHASLVALVDLRPELEVHQAAGIHPVTTYRVRLGGAPAGAAGAQRVSAALADLGLLDPRGRPRERLPAALTRRTCDAAAALRGAFMAAGSVSDPRGAPHLELRAAGEASAQLFAGLAVRCGAPGARATPSGSGWRVAVKSGRAIGSLLARMGAHTAFLVWDQARLRAELRGQANRAANADRANLARAVEASARQAASIQEALAVLDWDELAPHLQEVALVRLANPEASLAELGALLDPPVGKATVHRRLARLTELSTAVRGRAAGDSG